MRIANNDNISFRAYFKNNQLLKETIDKSFGKVDPKFLDKFEKECPNHEIEILSIAGHKFLKYYRLSNNNTNKMTEIMLNNSPNPLNYIIYKLVERAKDEKRYGLKGFWG